LRGTQPGLYGLAALMSVRESIKQDAAKLTASERKIANAVLADYPFGGLQTIQELAERTGVSAPSITRFVSKIGFSGYQDFQRQLIGELREGRRSPLDLKATEDLVDYGAFLADYARRTSARVKEMAETVSQEQFDQFLKLVADPSRNVFLIGGRISDSIANFLSVHLKQIRARIYHLPADSEQWPEHILRMRKQDVFIMFDFRRYQPDLASLADIVATKRQPSIVLITDKWMSPVARHSDIVIALPIDIGTAWDTAVCAITFVEALIVKVSEADWPATRKRIEAWDEVRLAPPGRNNGDKNEE
jgi:DNA-binding MurR/RpiR family transcriptional regulator